jgi:L-glutamine-phosphate cytidylyltransferase
MQLILLAAGRGTRLPKKFRNKPKCLAELNNKPIIDYNLEFFSKFSDKYMITGFKNNLLKKFCKKNKFKMIQNQKFKSTNMVYSMFLATKYVKEDVVICYGDIIFDSSVYNLLIESNNIMPLNVNWLKHWKKRMTYKDIIKDAEDIVVEKKYIRKIGEPIKKKLPSTQYMGIYKIKKKSFIKISLFFNKLENKKIDMTNFINKAITKNILKIKVKKFKSFWYEIDNEKDFNVAKKELK